LSILLHIHQHRCYHVLALAGHINSETTLDLFLPTAGDRPFYGAMVERRDGPSWLRDDDNDDGVITFNTLINSVFQILYKFWQWSIRVQQVCHVTQYSRITYRLTWQI